MHLIDKLSLYFHTIRRLRPIQMIHQLLHRLGTWKNYCVTVAIPKPLEFSGVYIPCIDQDPAYLQRFDLKALAENKICLLHQEYPFPWGVWQCAGASPLFQFNLHYHEYLIPLALRCRQTTQPADLQLFIRIVEDWLNTCCRVPDVTGKHKLQENWYDAWAPYTISLRAINWLICIEILGSMLLRDVKERMDRALYIQYIYLRDNLEKRLLANHYFENLKTLYILSLYFKEDKMHTFAWKHLSAQLVEQILPSGLHIERSFMYHRILLEGLMRCVMANNAIGKKSPDLLIDTVERMLSYSTSMEESWSRTPLFNDAGDNVGKSVSALIKAGRALGIVSQKYVQKEQPGYHLLSIPSVGVRLIVDIDVLGPSYMMGHSHCDCLSFELAVDGVPLFVNSGTYKYQGSSRQYFRGTSAHNTAMIRDAEQARCWGEHRVAQSLHSVKVCRISSGLRGTYKTWEGIYHEREFTINGLEVTVKDHFSPSYGSVCSYLRIAPEATIIRQTDGSIQVCREGYNICTIHALRYAPELVDDEQLTYYSPEFGLILKAHTLLFRWDSDEGFGGYRIVFTRR